MLSMVLAGHPKLKNDLRRSSMEEIGSRATIFELESLGSEKRKISRVVAGTIGCAEDED
jgi:type II secretory pathway predicted ATPase ExeA